MILHFSHIGFTDGLTFMILSPHRRDIDDDQGPDATPLTSSQRRSPRCEQDLA
jgi:hypothetical protein